ncbi:MAG: hypothetical protein PQJ46_11845, partial [Spirochaetales bacterium]|nr:hypothetical protein [Spirochaetales bacterium]
ETTKTADSDSQNVIFTVDGIQYDLINNYKNSTEIKYKSADAVIVSVTTKGDAEEGVGCQKFFQGDTQPDTITYFTNTAAWITSEGFLEDYSATSALGDVTYSSSAADGATVDSEGSFFSGFYIDGATYKISDLSMTLNGYGGDDFQGWGAGIVATNGSNVTVDKAYIDTKGVIRTAIWAGGESSTLAVTNSVIVGHNDDDATPYSDDDNYAVPMMEHVPFALGLVGNIRATNVLGSASASYTDSIIVCNSWGTLSTDSGTAGTKALDCSGVLSGIGDLEVADSSTDYTATKTVNGVKYGFTIATLGERSGYVTYADSGVYDIFEDVDFYAPDYIGIIASSSSLIHMKKDCYGYSERIGFLIHQNQGTENSGYSGYSGGLYVNDGKYDVADTFVVIKGGLINGSYTTTNVIVDGAEINLFGTHNYSGNLLRLMDSDDAGSPGTTTYTISDYTEAQYIANSPEKDVDDVVATFSNMTVDGDIYNTVYSVSQGLDVTLDTVTIDGIISSAYQTHVDADGSSDGVNGKELSAYTSGDHLYIGRVTSTPFEDDDYANPVYLTLVNSTWNVSGTSYLSKLTFDSSSTINGIITVDGETVTDADDYEGLIIVKAK